MTITQDQFNAALSNASAISGSFHSDSRYETFYETVGDQINGFTGIYELCADMARYLSEYENERGGISYWHSYAGLWVDVVDNYVDLVICSAIPSEQWIMPDLKATLKIAASKAMRYQE